jgi:hypothetical protein
VLIEGSGLGQTGINFSRGSVLTVEDCVVRNLTGDGIHFAPDASSSLSVSHSWVGSNGGFGIVVRPTGSASVTAVIDGATMQYNAAPAYGLSLDATATTGTVTGTATDSISSNNGGGFQAKGTTGAAADSASLMLVRSVAANNHTGVQSGDNGPGALDGTVRMTQVTITGNLNDWQSFGAKPGGVFSYGDNNIDGNGTASAAPTLIAKK